MWAVDNEYIRGDSGVSPLPSHILSKGHSVLVISSRSHIGELVVIYRYTAGWSRDGVKSSSCEVIPAIGCLSIESVCRSGCIGQIGYLLGIETKGSCRGHNLIKSSGIGIVIAIGCCFVVVVGLEVSKGHSVLIGGWISEVYNLVGIHRESGSWSGNVLQSGRIGVVSTISSLLVKCISCINGIGEACYKLAVEVERVHGLADIVQSNSVEVVARIGFCLVKGCSDLGVHV